MSMVFAYGSNMERAQMERRCPSARFRCRAILPGHALVFPRYSKNRKCGVSSVEPNRESGVWGVVYEIADTDLAALDKHEGYVLGRALELNAYNRYEMALAREGAAGDLVGAWVYVAVRQQGAPFMPSREYLRAIRVGADEWGLPQDHHAMLARIATLD